MSEISLIESYILRADGITEEKIKNYFSGIKYRGIYFVTMKIILAKKLRKTNKLKDVANILGLSNHATAYHHIHKGSIDKKAFQIVEPYLYEWIGTGVYPVSKTKRYTNNEWVTSSSKTDYILVEKKYFVNKIVNR